MDSTGFRKQTKIEDSMNVWQEFGQIQTKYKCVSLGEGAPHLSPPDFLADNLANAVKEGYNQYTSCYGHPEARKLIAEQYSKRFGRDINPVNEILLANGANGCLSVLMQALCADENDEIILIEPFFPPYIGHIEFARGTIRAVPLVVKEDNTWHLDLDVLRSTLNEKTRAILLNTPHNPTGKVFSYDELKEISDILEEHPHVYVVSDDVYDFLTFDDHKHHLFSTIGENWKKTVTIFSGGKILCCTGWKIGWCIGPADILRQAAVFNSCYNYCNNVPGQIAIARSIKTVYEEEYKGFQNFIEFERDDFKKSHDILVEGLKNSSLPFKPIPASGGYFIYADVSDFKDLVPEKYFRQEEYEDDKETTIEKNDFGNPVPLDLAVCRWLAMEKNVVSMPGIFFYLKSSEYKTDKYIRLAFCRGEELTKQAVEALK
jgi:kynurenine--oxoglutarate transaminase/cysteine-S-conjugate beta-lyase/glutamine--phenylpyruvate transaminase